MVVGKLLGKYSFWHAVAIGSPAALSNAAAAADAVVVAGYRPVMVVDPTSPGVPGLLLPAPAATIVVMPPSAARTGENP